MGVIHKSYPEQDCVLGIWEIQEDIDALCNLVQLDEEEIAHLESFHNDRRKIEWLSVRALINDMTGKNSKIIYNGSHKPYLHDWSYNISISHSVNLTSILLSRQRKVGIDLEYMSHDIEKIRHKFINEQEYITSHPLLVRYHLYIHWCAKEALYKICDKQDINFRINLTIAPFEPEENGEIKSTVTNKYGTEQYTLRYFRLGNYVIVWCIK